MVHAEPHHIGAAKEFDDQHKDGVAKEPCLKGVGYSDVEVEHVDRTEQQEQQEAKGVDSFLQAVGVGDLKLQRETQEEHVLQAGWYARAL